MEGIANSPVRPRSVRLPFRVLAAFILVASLLAFGASIAVKFGHSPVEQLRNLIFLPGLAWFCRLCFYAAAYGRSPAVSESWPFASSRVLGIYFCVLFFCSWRM
jgi:hypothetical protein